MRNFRTIASCLFLWLVVAGVSAAENPALSSVSLNSASVVGGNSVLGAVTLNMPAPSDVEVSLAADPSNAAKVPPSVTVPAGSTSATFEITRLLNKSAVVGNDASITIYGSYGVTKHASFTALAPVSFDRMVDRVVQSERAFVATMKTMHPLAETYIQNLREDKDHNVEPTSDQYFIGRLDISAGPEDVLFEKQRPGFGRHFMNPFSGIFSRRFMPRGFAQMVMLDADFQKSSYYFNFVRQEFLGEVRCVVVDVQPKESAPKGLFTGRIWVEDRDFNIVQFNGTYTPHSRYSYYLHFDSWRLNLQPGVWLPTYIYIEESGTQRSSPPFHNLYFKAQTRLWGYDVERLKHDQEFTQIQVETAQDRSESARDTGPVEAQRMWERVAEDNALDHLQKVGLLAPQGEVDRILQTVVNNLIITNKLEIVPDVRCRVLLTTPLESFTVGHTIVVSRGLLDVLPDEASLAMMLAHELGHIALGHRINTKLAFTDRSNLHHLQMIAPRIELDPATERQCRDLLNALHFQCRRGTGKRRQAGSLSIPEGVAQVRLDEAGKLRRTVLQCFQEQTGVAELVLIWGVGQQIHRFLIRSLFICRAASEVQTLERIYIGEKETVGECQLGVDAMTKRDMPKLMGQHHSQ